MWKEKKKQRKMIQNGQSKYPFELRRHTEKNIAKNTL